MANSQGVPDKMSQNITSHLKVAANASVLYSFYKQICGNEAGTLVRL